MSRRHAALRLAAEGVYAEDLSTNGTFVAGARLEGEVAVPFGAALAMGVFSLRVVEKEGEATAVPVEREATIPFVTHTAGEPARRPTVAPPERRAGGPRAAATAAPVDVAP